MTKPQSFEDDEIDESVKEQEATRQAVRIKMMEDREKERQERECAKKNMGPELVVISDDDENGSSTDFDDTNAAADTNHADPDPNDNSEGFSGGIGSKSDGSRNGSSDGNNKEEKSDTEKQKYTKKPPPSPRNDWKNNKAKRNGSMSPAESTTERQTKRRRIQRPPRDGSESKPHFEMSQSQGHCINCARYMKKIEEFEEVIAGKNCEIRERNQKINNILEPSIPCLDNAKTKQLEGKISVCNAKIEELEKIEKDREKQVAAMQKEKESLEAELEKMKEQLEKANSENRALKDKLEKSNSESETLKKKVKKANRRSKVWKKKFNDSIQFNDDTIVQKNLERVDLELENKAFKDEDKLCRAALVGLEETLGGVTAVEKAPSLLHEQMNDFAEKVSALKFTFNELANANAEKEQELKEIKSKLQQLELEMNKEESEKESREAILTSQSESLQKADLELGRLQEEALKKAEQSSKKIKELETEKEHLSSQKSALEASVKSLEESVTRLSSHLTVLLEPEKEYKKTNNYWITGCKMSSLSDSFEKLKFLLRRLLHQVGEKEEDQLLKLHYEVEWVQKLSLEQTNLLKAWNEYETSIYENPNQSEDAPLYLCYDIEALQLGIEEAERDLLSKQGRLAQQQKEQALIEQEKLMEIVKAQHLQIKRLEGKVKRLEISEMNALEVIAQRESNTEQAKRIAQLDADLKKCQTGLTEALAIHNEEVGKMIEIIKVTTGQKDGAVEADKNKVDSAPNELVQYLTESGRCFLAEAKVKDKELAKLKCDKAQLECTVQAMIKSEHHLKEEVLRRDARIAELEHVQPLTQQLRPQKHNETTQVKCNNETLIPSSGSVVVAASTGPCSSTSVVVDTDNMNCMQKEPCDVLQFVLESNQAMTENKEDEEYGSNVFQEEATTPFDSDFVLGVLNNTTTNPTALAINGGEGEGLSPGEVGFQTNTSTSVAAPEFLSSSINKPILQLVTPCGALETTPSGDTWQLYSSSTSRTTTTTSNATPPSFCAPSTSNPATDSESDVEKQKTAQKQFEKLRIRVRKGNKPSIWKCDVCPKMCSSKSNLKQHVKDVHLGIGKVRCTICLDFFQNKSNLTKHLKTKHKIESVGKEKKGI